MKCRLWGCVGKIMRLIVVKDLFRSTQREVDTNPELIELNDRPQSTARTVSIIFGMDVHKVKSSTRGDTFLALFFSMFFCYKIWTHTSVSFRKCYQFSRKFPDFWNIEKLLPLCVAYLEDWLQLHITGISQLKTKQQRIKYKFFWFSKYKKVIIREFFKSLT